MGITYLYLMAWESLAEHPSDCNRMYAAGRRRFAEQWAFACGLRTRVRSDRRARAPSGVPMTLPAPIWGCRFCRDWGSAGPGALVLSDQQRSIVVSLAAMVVAN
jgi:hypothetical protein